MILIDAANTIVVVVTATICAVTVFLGVATIYKIGYKLGFWQLKKDKG